MITENSVSDQTYQYFLQESAELLQTMDDELQNLRETFSVQKVHNLMRAAHTLKGASASVGLDAVKNTTHSLEDVFKALCHSDTVISVEMEGLIFQGYDCLKLLMSAQLAGATVDEADILDRMATVVTQLQTMLGDRFGQGGHLPTSSELGFDMTKSIFEVGVAQRIDALAEALAEGDPEEVIDLLETQMEVFIGLAESLDLPGFGSIAETTLVALAQSPDKILEIAAVALADYKAAQAQVLAGDRLQGGTPSAALRAFCGELAPPLPVPTAVAATNAATNAEPPTQSMSSRLTHQPSKRQAQRQEKIKAKTRARRSRSAASMPAKASWLKRLWTALSKPIGGSNPTSRDPNHAEQGKNAAKLNGSTTPSVPANFTDYAAEGDEPADLALFDLVPSSLSEINLPFAQLISEADFDSDSIDLAELTPLDLNAFAIDSSSADPSAGSALLPTIEPPSVPLRPQNNATIRMSVDHLDQLSQAMGELLTHQNRQALYNEQLAALVKKLLSRIAQQQQQLNRQRNESPIGHSSQKNQPQTPLSTASASTHSAYTHFDSLELDQYSDVQLLAQSFLEETVQQSESAEAIDLFVRRSAQELEKQKRLLANTRETLLSARMLPLEKIFQRFPSALSRLQIQHNKPVELVLVGEDVLVDKVIADKLYDPLLHLVRNAFDHGIESAESRLQQNKSAQGIITIEALQRGRHLVINVKDDGLGLNLEMIRSKAVESQFITAEEAAQLNPDQIVDLLFEAGFSTASEVDDLSGRGVGLDAVRAQVRSLQGWVSVSYAPGTGTCFSLQIPSSLTIAKLLLCQAQGRIYALIADAIEHILMPTAAQVKVWDGGKMLTWQANGEEYLLPVNALAEVLQYASPMPNHRLTGTHSDIRLAVSNPVILLNHQGTLVGIEVDQLLGEQELVISSLGETIVPPAYLYGSSILPDGQLTLVLDGVMLAKIVLDQRNQGSIDISVSDDVTAPSPTRLNPAKSEPAFIKKLILTVDDSITVRNALTEALQKADYQVIQARDGAEALQQLQRYPDVQAILCDIEMPGMNGFEFLKARQQMPEIAAIPTIMLTSRAGSKHRFLTKELGATTYLTKPYLTPQLLKTVADAIEEKNEDKTQQPSLVGDSHE